MAKKTSPPPAYLKSLTIDKVKCFKDKQTLDFSDGNGKPAQWTVILGNNGTGKTTLLQCIASLEPINSDIFFQRNTAPLSTQTPKRLVPNLSTGGLILTELDVKVSIECSSFFGKKISVSTKPAVYPRFGIKESSITPVDCYSKIGGLQIYFYPANRRIGKSTLAKKDPSEIDKGIGPYGNMEMLAAEEWLMQMDYAEKRGGGKKYLGKVKKILLDILPDINSISFKTRDEGMGKYVSAIAGTTYGSVPLRNLSYGYLVMMGWITDLAKKMADRYPNSTNPLAEPAIVLVDEIDLHVHPEWQRKIINHLSSHFPNTQFIVSTHSPLIIQSVEKINVVMLKQEQDRIEITNRVNKNCNGWTIEEILNEMMGVEKTHSDNLINLVREFEDGLKNVDKKKTQKAYQNLDKILHPHNGMRKLLRVQMSTLG